MADTISGFNKAPSNTLSLRTAIVAREFRPLYRLITVEQHVVVLGYLVGLYLPNVLEQFLQRGAYDIGVAPRKPFRLLPGLKDRVGGTLRGEVERADRSGSPFNRFGTFSITQNSRSSLISPPWSRAGTPQGIPQP
jgi:hypothetical protein